jgi:hypothetical protein
MALTILIGTVGGDSIIEAWSRLDDLMPIYHKLDVQSRKRVKNRLAIDHDIAERVSDIAKEIEPWLKQLAEREDYGT